MSGLITCRLGGGTRAEMQSYPQHSEIVCFDCGPSVKRFERKIHESYSTLAVMMRA